LLIQYWFPTTRGYLLGCYSQANYIAGLPNTFASSLSQTVAYRLYTATRVSQDQLKVIADGITRVISRALIPFTLVLVFCPEDLLKLLYGDSWLGAAPMLRILGVYSIVVATYSNLRSLLIAVGRWRELYRIYLVALVCYIGLMCSPLNQDIYAATGIFVFALVIVLVMIWSSVNRTVELDFAAAWRVPVFVGVGSGLLLLAIRANGSPLRERPVLNLFVTFVIPTIVLAVVDRQLVIQCGAALFSSARGPVPDITAVAE
jgi:O-antigen/teichoic acid export membrane protein